MTTIPSNEDSPAHSNVILSPETTAPDDTSEPELTIPPSQQPNPIEAHKVDPNEYETIQEAEPEEHVQTALPQEPVVETITIDDDLTPTQRNSINMLNYLTVLTQQINDSKGSRLFLEQAYGIFNSQKKQRI